MGEIAARGDRLAMNRCDLEFHRLVWVTAGNDVLMRMWEAISRYVLIIFGLETETDRDFDGIQRQHAHLLSVLEAGDAAAVDEEIERHIKQLGYRYDDPNDVSTKQRKRRRKS